METSLDSLREIGFTFIVLVAAFVAVYMTIQRYNLADHFTGGLMTSAPLPLMQVQQVGQVFNPFVLNLLHSRTASVKDGATFTLMSSVPCWLGAFWGAKIADVYPIIYSPWPSFQDHATFKQSMRSISQHSEEFLFADPVEKREVTFKAPSFLDLGLPPRTRYPILLVALDTHAVNSSWHQVQHLQQIVCMVAIVHLRDDNCPSESHIFSQLVRCPLGRPCDLKQLYMSGLENSSTTNESSTNLYEGDGQSAPAEGPDDVGPLCSICQSAPVEQAILPCRHACTCTGCCTRLINCPICRAFIISTFPLEST